MLLNKFRHFYKTLSLFDFIRKFIFFSSAKIQHLFLWFVSLKGLLYFKKSNCKIGFGVKFFGLTHNIKVGDDFNIYNHCIFEFGNNAELIIGDNCVLSYGVLIACNKSIRIGDNVQIGEYTSVRDTTHTYTNPDISIKFQKDASFDIMIGNNVWIGRGCLIMPGTVIGDGAIIGANSVVKGSIIPNGIYAGSPATFIKSRF